METKSSTTFKIFCCYAREDHYWYDKLYKHLSSLWQQNLVELWDENRIRVGHGTGQERDKLFDQAHILIFLISSSFLASENYAQDMNKLELHKQRKLPVIPLLVEHVDITGTPFEHLQRLPKDGGPIAQWRDLNEALVKVVEELRIVADELRKSLPPPNPSPLPIHDRQAASCPFVAGPMITDPLLFVGRKDLLQMMATLMGGLQPTSINIFGKRRIGKSSLLYHFYQTWERRVTQVNQFVVLYLSLQEARCHTQTSFYHTITNRLLQCPMAQARPELKKGLSAPTPDASTFADLCSNWKEIGVLPVLCLDDFDVLPRRPQEFDDLFFEHLRSLMNNSSLMLIVASEKPLSDYYVKCKFTSKFWVSIHPGEITEKLVRLSPQTCTRTSCDLLAFPPKDMDQKSFNDGRPLSSEKPLPDYYVKYKFTSQFFNDGLPLSLEWFSDDEVTELLRQPASTIPSTQAALSLEEQRTAREWGGHHPYYLQLAAYLLWQARQLGKDQDWAKAKFERDSGCSQRETDGEKSTSTLPAGKETSQIETPIPTNQSLIDHHHSPSVAGRTQLKRGLFVWLGKKLLQRRGCWVRRVVTLSIFLIITCVFFYLATALQIIKDLWQWFITLVGV